VSLARNGDATIHGITSLTGTGASQLREELLAQGNDERRLWLETYLAERCPGVQVDTFRFEGVEPVHDTVNITYQFHARQFSLIRGGMHVMRPGEVAPSDLSVYFRAVRRRYPIRFRYALRSEVHVTIHDASLPSLTEQDGGDSVRSAFGEYRRASREEGGVWHFDATR